MAACRTALGGVQRHAKAVTSFRGLKYYLLGVFVRVNLPHVLPRRTGQSSDLDRYAAYRTKKVVAGWLPNQTASQMVSKPASYVKAHQRSELSNKATWSHARLFARITQITSWLEPRKCLKRHPKVELKGNAP